jgi:hypothetical protein
MKITTSYLKKLINEEIRNILLKEQRIDMPVEEIDQWDSLPRSRRQEILDDFVTQWMEQGYGDEKEARQQFLSILPKHPGPAPEDLAWAEEESTRMNRRADAERGEEVLQQAGEDYSDLIRRYSGPHGRPGGPKMGI